MKFFSVDGPLYKLLNTLVTLVELNFLWMLCSLPIITMGGATIAAYDVIMKIIGGEEGYVAKDFFVSFKVNFRNGIPYGLLMLLCSYVVWLDFSLFNQIEGNPMILLIMGFLAAIIFVACFLFAFPLQAKYQNTFLNTMKNSANICMKFFLRTLTLIIALVFQLFLFYWNGFTLALGFFIGPASMIYTVGCYARYFFAQLEKEPGVVIPPEEP